MQCLGTTRWVLALHSVDQPNSNQLTAQVHKVAQSSLSWKRSRISYVADVQPVINHIVVLLQMCWSGHGI